ncbi:MAG: 4Fe-4S ferredoxin [Ignavibacteriae bacterium HGW-Ignavibacteriae-3]|nr:MAG: 4Fe-4S ferredoxin [Ignavibacteriae bacterium HGW-Ignavibacteriae-3]
MIRKIIKIDEEKCDGCGNCVPECHEGALQIIDGKARLISDLFCDGLGACLGNCPPGALTIEEREAEPYDERKVMDYIMKGGTNVIIAHLKHLRDHEEFEYLTEALEFLREKGIENPLSGRESVEKQAHSGCPGSQELTFKQTDKSADENGARVSHLRQWPVQLHLVSPQAQFFKNSDLLLAADCCAFAYPDFHKDFLKGKSLAIACPKLDSNKQVYLDKLLLMINESNLKSITVLIMTVPCCNGLAQLAQQAVEISKSAIPVNVSVISPTGELVQSVQIN